MSREYLVFGSNDGGETLIPVGTYKAADHDAAKRAARATGYESYGTCPVGNWSFGRITVREIVDVEEVPLPIAGQMTVEEVIEEAKHDAITEARQALDDMDVVEDASSIEADPKAAQRRGE